MNSVPGHSIRGCWNAALSILGDAGVDTVFGLPGDDLDALSAADRAGARFVVARDQRNAVFMAVGYALQSGRPGVALVGKGPAVTNTVTGLLEAACSAAPVVLLSGGTSIEHRGSGAFQELDQLSVIAPLVKWAARVDHPARLVPTLRRALLVAGAGVPGPVYVELPDHLLTEEIPVRAESAPGAEVPAAVTLPGDSAAVRALRSAERPLLLVGGGMRHGNVDGIIERFAEAHGAAITCTASGRGAVDESSTLFCGLSGLYTPEEAARLWAETDCVLALGSRLEETATFGWPEGVGTEVPVIQVNVDAAEFATGFAGPKVLADARAVLGSWPAPQPREAWAETVRGVHAELRAAQAENLRSLHEAPELHIAEVLEALQDVLPADRVLVQENGLQDMWSYRFPLYTCDGPGGSIVPSEQTSLGFGAAAAVGVKRAAPDRPVVAFVGDGAFGLFDADLPTAVAHGGGIIYVVLRNGGYGWLQSQLNARTEKPSGFAFLDSAAVGARAADLPGVRQVALMDKNTLAADIAQAWKAAESGEVVVLNVPVRIADAMFTEETAGGDFPVVPPIG
ncbi:acetolactate synthase [Amycolatopsis antarctica]|uniref:Acetolactate synthase n=1 Tax=Amycolatopsis antarctica TaxID=1854586 RepID=A0A263D5M5_9PSEU|nr:thiamine pyrophosphate-binding protein [Amycolatopsis antarctica]OZM72897.1 acetolactate synthase [Amycolatopsis antarctica]